MAINGRKFGGRRSGRNFIRQFFVWNQEGENGGVEGGSGSDAGATPVDPSPTAEGGHVAEVSSGAPVTPPTSNTFADRIPAAFKDKPYIANILSAANPEEELFKQFDGLQTKLGQRPAGLPADDASDEDWTKFRESVRPKTADEYTFPALDLGEEGKQVADFINTFKDEASEKELRNIMFEAGVPKKIAHDLMGKLEKWQVSKFGDTFKQVAQAKAEDEKVFGEVAQEFFGGNIEDAMKKGSEYIARHVPEKLRARLDGLPPQALLALAVAGVNEHKAHGKEDTISGGAAVSGLSVAEMQAEMQRLMSDDAHRNKANPGHEANKARLKELSNAIANIYQKNVKR